MPHSPYIPHFYMAHRSVQTHFITLRAKNESRAATIRILNAQQSEEQGKKPTKETLTTMIHISIIFIHLFNRLLFYLFHHITSLISHIPHHSLSRSY